MNSPRRFVPTLTDVVRPEELMATAMVQATSPDVDVVRAEQAMVVGQENGSAASQESGLVAESAQSTPDAAALVAKVCETVHQTLDDHLRTMVMQQVQAQQLLLIQSLRAELLPLVHSLVEDAVQAALQQRSSVPE